MLIICSCRMECMYMCPMRAGRWQWSMVHLLGTHLVTVWEDCQVVASCLMNPMHNAVQAEVVGPPNHLHAICPLHFNVRSHSWYWIFNRTYVYTWPHVPQSINCFQVLLDLFVLSWRTLPLSPFLLLYLSLQMCIMAYGLWRNVKRNPRARYKVLCFDNKMFWPQ